MGRCGGAQQGTRRWQGAALGAEPWGARHEELECPDFWVSFSPSCYDSGGFWDLHGVEKRVELYMLSPSNNSSLDGELARHRQPTLLVQLWARKGEGVMPKGFSPSLRLVLLLEYVLALVHWSWWSHIQSIIIHYAVCTSVLGNFSWIKILSMCSPPLLWFSSSGMCIIFACLCGFSLPTFSIFCFLCKSFNLTFHFQFYFKNFCISHFISLKAWFVDFIHSCIHCNLVFS